MHEYDVEVTLEIDLSVRVEADDPDDARYTADLQFAAIINDLDIDPNQDRTYTIIDRATGEPVDVTVDASERIA